MPLLCARGCIDQSNSVARLVGHMFFPFPFGDRHPHVTHCSSGQAHSSSQTASRSVQPFLYGSQLLCCTMLCQWEKNTQNCPVSLGFRHPATGEPSHVHRQHAQEFGKHRACGSGDILADRHTHTDVLITILRN